MKRRGPLLLLLLILLGVVMMRWRLLEVPLERDEGEYAYHAQLLLDGIPPYTLVYSMKVPGMVLVYAVILTVFGETITAVHLGLMVANVAATALMYMLGRRLCDEWAGLVAAACYALLTVSPRLDGPFANTEQFLLVPALAGFVLLLRAIETTRRRDLALAGVMFGLSLLIKQHAIFLAGCAGLYLLFDRTVRRRQSWRSTLAEAAVFATGPIALWGLLYLWMWMAGVFEQFWFMTVRYASEYAQFATFEQMRGTLQRRFTGMFTDQPAIWVLMLIGLIAAWRHPRLRGRRVFVALFFVLSFLGTTPGLHFRQHYFVIWMPAVALMGGLAVSMIAASLPRARWAMAAIAIVCLGLTVFQMRQFLFIDDPITISRKVHGINPFPESIEIAKYIRENSSPDDTLVIIGSEPQIHFYSRRRSVTGHIYVYPMLEPQPFAERMTEEMIADVEAADPEYLILVRMLRESWVIWPGAESRLITWAQDYARRGFSTVMLVEFDRENMRSRTSYEQEARRKPATDAWIRVMRRVRKSPPSTAHTPPAPG